MNENPTDADEQYKLAMKYGRGEGVSKNMNMAILLFTKAAEQGHAEAQALLGNYYFDEKDIEKSVYWTAKAAEQGILSAQFNMGIYCQGGLGDELEDKEKSAYWFTKAAEQGYEAAQYNIGVCYFKGYGVLKNLDMARYWFTKAAEQGNKDAKEMLSSL